jgi:hypothetical protein
MNLIAQPCNRDVSGDSRGLIAQVFIDFLEAGIGRFSLCTIGPQILQLTRTLLPGHDLS